MIATAVHPHTEQVAAAIIPAQRVMTNAPRPIAVSDLTLAATSTAVNVSLLLLHCALADWGRPELASSGTTLLSELVGEAVKLTGVPDPSTRWLDLDDLALVHVRLRLFDDKFVIEVADRHREPSNPSAAFRSLSKRWNFYPTSAGRVVWCELALVQHELTDHGLPKRRPSPVPPPTPQPPTSPQDRDLLQRVRKALDEL
jgi:hypothetical protein